MFVASLNQNVTLWELLTGEFGHQLVTQLKVEACLESVAGYSAVKRLALNQPWNLIDGLYEVNGTENICIPGSSDNFSLSSPLKLNISISFHFT